MTGVAYRGKLDVPVTPATIGSFLCLLGLLYQAHELGHHFFGGLACGRLGTVSLSTYNSVKGCALLPDLLTELFGPFVSLSIAYAAAFRLRSRASLLMFGCVFASYFHLRWVPPILGGGDELDVARKLSFGNGPAIAALLFLLGLPPIVIAWRVMASVGRWWRFALVYLLPLPFLLYVDALAARVSGPNALLPGLANVDLFNIPLSLLLLDLCFGIGFAALGACISTGRGK